MAVMTDVRNVGAGATVDNILTGKIYEFAQQDSIISLSATGAVAGIKFSFIIGNQLLIDDQEVSSANRFPLVPDDFLTRGGALKGDRVVVRIRNTTGGAANAFSRVEIDAA
jgi:hypothetical protein